MCDYFGINIKTTAAKSPWSNSIVERNNQTLANTRDKINSDTNYSPELALTWAGRFQLVSGKNPKLPSTLSKELPALTIKPILHAIEEDLTAIHTAQSGFIASKNDERIKWALAHNISATNEVKYVSGDRVLYKRDNSNKSSQSMEALTFTPTDAECSQ